MKFYVAYTRNHHPQFAIVPITVAAYNDDARLPALKKSFQRQLKGTQVVLMCTDGNGERWFYGQGNLVDYLVAADTSQLAFGPREFNDKIKGFWEEVREEYLEWLRKNWFKTVVGVVAGQYGIPGPPPGQ